MLLIYRYLNNRIHKQLWILLFLSFFYFYLQGKDIKGKTVIQFLDQTDSSLVADVSILTKDGSLHAISDMTGKLLLEFSSLSASDTVYFYHLNYVDAKIKVSDLIKTPMVFLKPEIFRLPEIVVSPLTEEYSYYILSTYFRTWQFENEIPKFFMDGIIKFHIPISKKGKIKGELIEYRKYRNKKIIDIEESNIKKKFISVSIAPFGVPRIHNLSMFNRLNKKYYQVDLIKLEKGYLHYKISADQNEKTHTGTTSGEAILDSMQRQLKFSIFRNYDYSDTIKFLGYWGSPLIYTYIEKYSLSNNLHHLNYMKDYKKDIFKHKKEKKFKTIENSQEVFVLDVQLEHEQDFKRAKNKDNIQKNISSFYTNFWNNILIPQLPEPIQNQLDKTLIMYPNVLDK